MDYLKMGQCERGVVYRIHSRNLAIGVYDGKGGFVGLREKFGRTYLFTEFHHDTGAPYGTVHPLEKIGVLPDGVEILEHVEVIERECSCAHPSADHVRRCQHEGRDCSIGCRQCECSYFNGKRYLTDYRPLFEFLETLGRTM